MEPIKLGKKKREPSPMFATYETLSDLIDYADTLSGNEKRIAILFIGLTTNTMCHVMSD
jgi:hypothetical protein